MGHWEGDTLVIDTTRLVEDSWLGADGWFHSNKMHVVERYRRPDLGHLEWETTIDDPGAYTKTWTSAWTLTWVPNEELPVYYCQDSRP